jgi:Integrase core domain
MDHKLSKEARGELLAALRERYGQASREQKSLILDEVVALANCHRKHAIRLLREKEFVVCSAKASRRVYDEAVRQALIVLWEAADRICGKRMKAVLPALLEALERHGHLNVETAVRARLLAASAATIDRLLAPMRSSSRGRRRRKVASRPSQQVPIRTFADWRQPPPGYLEIDFVAHGGSSMEGNFLWSLVATDVCSGWTETVALLAREQSLVVEGLEVLRRQFPVPIVGIDSDNDSAFINDTLVDYCRQQRIEFTRSRAYRKNDQAWIEQKNGAVIRRFVGYERLSGMVAGQVLAQLYQGVRLYVNFFQPSFQLRSKQREGAKVRKKYDAPATPCARLLGHASVAAKAKAALGAQGAGMDPLELLHRIREAQTALAALSSGEPGDGLRRESLEQFLAALPELWRQGEARPTHRGTPRSARSWRTRKDPFEAVWPEILIWLQESPDATAKSLFERLHQAYADTFSAGQLRTLQRRIREWRRMMARQLVYAGCAGTEANAEVVGTGASERLENLGGIGQ